jgi:integrase
MTGHDPMHPLYQDILDTKYKNHAFNSRKSIIKFYSDLPPPEKLSPDFVSQRLEGLTPGTQKTYITFLHAIEKKLGVDITSHHDTGKVKPLVKKTDLYSKEEINRILEACIETRDKALIAVLYESAFRSFELLQLTFKKIRPTNKLWWATVIGKGSRQRTIPLLHSVPALRIWMDNHPVNDGYIFTTFRRPHNQFSYNGLYNRIALLLDRADVDLRPRPIHLFRHTRLTELVGLGMTEYELCQYAGWEIGSNMPKTYVHLSGRDLKRSYTRIYGLDEEPDDEPALKMEIKDCPNCKTPNAPNAKYCSLCSFVLDELTALRLDQPDTSSLSGENLRALIREVIHEEQHAPNSSEDQS